ncbi:MAG TPA: nucleotidyltransferase domain-containing protein, partial [Gammaproteobacteria bacterium]|nr:nucleotidyltransferase domain-containing protein [Gammaproteobacteria bacterium]
MNASVDTPDVLDTDTLDRRLAADGDPLPLLREALQHANRALERRFEEDVPAYQLVTQRARVVDAIVCRAWEHAMGGWAGQVALVAVGGYGRGELHPHSDVDLMALVAEVHDELRAPLEGFLQFLWDVGLEVGHSVRTVEDCIEQGARDITVATNLMESRLLRGPEDLYQEMRARTGPDHLWPSRDFFEAKWREQVARHYKFDDTAYNLEPNIKEGPGGLRDIQMVGWVAKRHFGDETLKDLVERGFLTAWEYKTLIEGQNFL